MREVNLRADFDSMARAERDQMLEMAKQALEAIESKQYELIAISDQQGSVTGNWVVKWKITNKYLKPNYMFTTEMSRDSSSGRCVMDGLVKQRQKL